MQKRKDSDSRRQFFFHLSTRPGALCALVSPALPNGAAALVPLKQDTTVVAQGPTAHTQAVVQVAGLHTIIHAGGPRGVQ